MKERKVEEKTGIKEPHEATTWGNFRARRYAII